MRDYLAARGQGGFPLNFAVGDDFELLDDSEAVAGIYQSIIPVNLALAR